MTYDPDKHHRRSIRLKDYDYSQPGGYFVTICTHQRACLLGEIVECDVQLSALGKIVKDRWLALPDHYLHVALDQFVIMPNHVHGIIVLKDPDYDEIPESVQRHALPEIMRGFKTYSARRINDHRRSPGAPVWQRTFYDHIIRNEKEWFAIQEYILNNPAKWAEDEDNRANWT